MSRVIQAIQNLQEAIYTEYNRTGVRVSLEPEAFNKLVAQLQDMLVSNDLPQPQTWVIQIAGPGGYMPVVMDGTLGNNWAARNGMNI